MPTLSLFPASAHGNDFIFEAFKISMREYVEWPWEWNEEFQRGGFWANLPVQLFQLICVGGRNAGGDVC